MRAKGFEPSPIAGLTTKWVWDQKLGTNESQQNYDVEK
jgi:hypothetical protein